MIRVGVVSPEPTPYRAPLFDRVAALPGIDLTVIYSGRTIVGREWNIELGHRAVFLDGPRVPVSRLLRHEYRLTLDVLPLLERERFDCLVVAGWSLFAAQAAVVWARLRRVPYLVTMESHLFNPRPATVRALKRLVVPRVLRPAAGVLVTGSASRAAALSYGVASDRVRIVANTVDIETLASEVDSLRARREELRAALGLEDSDVAALCVARLMGEKALDVLVRASARVPEVRLVLAGGGEDERTLGALADETGARVLFAGFVESSRLPRLYAASDVFALVSRSETWGVVVNEAAAAGLPLLLSDRVGAAADLLCAGENGELVPVDDVEATAAALRRLAGDPALRSRYGARSRELVAGWGYEPSVEAFADAVRGAVRR